MSIDKQGGKIAFVCDVCSARFEPEATDQRPGKVHELWIAAEKALLSSGRPARSDARALSRSALARPIAPGAPIAG
jgi:hypothetical protein